MGMGALFGRKSYTQRAVRQAKRFAFLSSSGIAAPVSGRCLLCGKEQLSFEFAGLCDECRGKITPNAGKTCEKCGRPLIAEERFCETCREKERHFDRAYSCYVYEDAARQLVTRFKYAKALYIARQMAYDMAELYFTKDVSCSLIVPSPSSAERIKERGYDHIAVLTEFLRGIINIPVAYGAVVKGKDNKMQAGLGGVEREENVLGVYSGGENSGMLKGAHVLVVDDVLTTGATASEVAKVAKKFGAEEVKVLTFASTRYSAGFFGATPGRSGDTEGL